MGKNKTIKVPDKQSTVKTIKTRNQNFLWIYFASLFLILPVTFSVNAVDQVLVPRFLILSLVLFAFYGFTLINNKNDWIIHKYITEPVLIIWLFFLVFSVIALLNAVNPVEGLFDIFRTLIQFLLLLLFVTILEKTKDLKHVVLFIAVTSLIYLAVGYVQYFTYAFGRSDLQSLYKIIGIWTHKNFFSSMLFLMFPVLLYGYIFYSGYDKIFAGLIFLDINLVSLVQTRSVWLSFIVFIFVFGISVLILRKKITDHVHFKWLFPKLLTITIVVIIAVFSAWGITEYSVNNPIKTAKNPKKSLTEQTGDHPEQKVRNIDERVASIFNPRESNTRHRLEMWKMSLRMIKQHPLLGVGTGNWKIVVSDYLPADYNKNYFNNIRRPHNDLLWVFSEKGIFGLLSYLCFFLLVVIYAFRLIFSLKELGINLTVLIFLAGIAGYFADAMLSFPYERIEHQVMLMFFCAVIIFYYRQHFPVLWKIQFFQGTGRKIKILFVVLSAISIYLGQKWFSDEKAIKKSIEANLKSNWVELAENSEKAIHPFSQLDARNIPPAWYCGKAWLMLNDIERADDYLQIAYSQNPNSILVLVDFGAVKGIKGETEEAIRLLKKAIGIYPSFKDAYKNLAVAYYNKKDYENSLKCFEKLASLEYNPEVEKIINEIKNTKLKK